MEAEHRELPIIFQGAMVRAILGKLKTQTRRTVRHFNSTVDGGPANLALWAKLDFENAWVDPACIGGAPCLKVPCQSEDTVHRVRCKYEAGDRLWVRENWAQFGNLDPGYLCYQATYPDEIPPNVENVPKTLKALKKFGYRWKPSIHMPRWASRITTEVLAVGVERVQEISEQDAKSEGIACLSKDQGRTWKYGIPEADGWPGPSGWQWQQWQESAREAFRVLWDSINAIPKPQGVTHLVSYPWGEDSRDPRKEINGRPHYCHPNPWVWPITFKVLEGSR